MQSLNLAIFQLKSSKEINLKTKTAICMAALSLLGCSSKPDVEVTIQTNPHWGTLMFTIQAINDEAIIKDVVVNRGNCKLPPGTAEDIKRTVKLGFGKNYRGYSSSCTINDVKEIQVTTNTGTFTFSF